ncbi:DNA-binding response regulator [Edaphobacter acidisoli]|uniref:DNA-binding response regulator n=1 Tax=Edaphobacter acidisoli TaxID=2040573 RepID=A0A916RMD3_9BACT|nr:response regulator transcription factor [Edaphobacter acidisoli]GGA59389.1 DNA-binding response regulator [Edaphobacter acidisoli]
MPDQVAQKILVVDDEPQITRVLRSSLVSNGYEVQTAQDGLAALEKIAEWTPDIVITDLAMPRMDGVELCSEIRAHSNVPIIVLSVREQEAVKVRALDAGADDYITKPFGIQELLARVRAHARRQKHASIDHLDAPLSVGGFLIDKGRHRVEINGREIRLSPKEFDLLLYMAQRPGRVLTHRMLLTAIWGPYATEQPESLRVLVAQLRKKIEPGPEPRYIVNEPWVGYRFQIEEKQP